MSSLQKSGSRITQQLLLSIADQIKLPLVQIAQQTELAEIGITPDIKQIHTIAENGLRLLDGYSLGLQLTNKSMYELTPESVSISSIMYDATQQLDSYARIYDVQLKLNITGKYGPVLAHRQGLQSAIVGLASAFIEALPSHIETEQSVIQLATHRCRYGIVAGVYANIPELSSETLRKGRRLYGLSRQPLVEVSHTGGSGIFVADAIFKAMNLKMHVSRHQNLYGLGVVLNPSPQLSLV